MNLAEIKTANRRWTILALLAGDSDHETESGLIQRGIHALNRSHDASMSMIYADLRWLEARLLVALTVEGERVYARLTQRGRDVAAGRERVAGIDEPPLE